MKTTTDGQLVSGGGRAVIARAFTLVEILISLAALALIAVGLATIFGAIGRTVTAGRSVSAFTSYAALIERQMRADFEGMSREFPLVIRNEWAGDFYDPNKVPPPGIPLNPTDNRPRPRRIDEIIFGIKGRFASAREPLYPGVTARGDSASIYYGHGQRRIEDPNPAGPYRRPTLDDSNFDPQAGLGVSANGNPNRYAGDWMLLRHPTVFAGPTTTQDPPPPLSDGVAYLDNDVQVGLQPAASSPFRKLSIVTPDALPQKPPYDKLVRDPVHPQLVGGLVDAVTSDFSEVRSIITAANARPTNVNSEADLANAISGGSYLATGPAGLQTVDRVHEWMDELLPSWSMAYDTGKRVRMRYEPAAPDYFAALKQLDDIKSSWGRADQVMLSSSNFLPHCSEFIVEWSFGKVWTPMNPITPGWDPQKAGSLIWHGLKREVSLDPKNPGVLTTVAQPYDETVVQNGLNVFAFNALYWPHQPKIDPASGRPIPDEYLVTRRRIHGLAGIAPPGKVLPLTSYFGYVDPQFSPDRDGNGSVDDPVDAVSSSIPWAWPELIRVTISLADPNDSTVEQTFQFVFNAPGNQTR